VQAPLAFKAFNASEARPVTAPDDVRSAGGGLAAEVDVDAG
jgi:hypothetical protein